MPIRTNLNESPYYDDYDITKQYHRVLFRPGYAVQARELTQLQTILQNQVEQFGDNIFKEGSIIKGCNFTELSALKYVKVTDTAVNILNPDVNITVNEFVGGVDETTGIETFYEIVGATTQLRALIIAADFGFETNDPDLNTFYINYLNSNSLQDKVFDQGETLEIYKYTIENDITGAGSKVAEFTVTNRYGHVGDSFGIESAVGITYQKGHFLYAKQQIVILSKYTNVPDGVSIGYRVQESLITPLSDSSLYDNSIGTPNQNAPGANRLKLEPILVAIPTSEADADNTFFTISRYVNGIAVQTRDVSQYNVIGEEMAKRTFEESGNYIVRGFKSKIIDGPDDTIQATIEPGVAYVKGFRVETKGELFVPISQLDVDIDVETQPNQPISFNYGSYVDIANTASVGTLPVGTYQTANLKNSGGTTIGTAMVRNFTPTKVYLSNIRMGANNFADVASINGAAGSVKITPTIKQKSNDALIFNIGETFLKNVTDISIPVRKARSLTTISDSFTLTALSGEDFNVQLDDTLIVDSTQDSLQISSIVKDSETQLTINLVSGQSPTVNGTIYYNSRIQLTEPHAKLDTTLYVKASYSAGTNKYSLGFPDAYQLVSVVDANGTNVTNSFRLRSNQTDHYYDRSYIEYIAGRPVPAIGLMTITFKAFKVSTATGSYFFTVDSYPSDLDLSYIPTYTTSSGTTINLRDCFDFRPHAANTVSYTSAEVIGTAPTVSTAVDEAPTFSGTFLIPALNSAATADLEYYLNRTDVITIDSYGKFSTVEGIPDRKSRPPTIGNDRLVIAEVYVPGYPAIPSSRAALENKPDLAMKSKTAGDKVYTMKKIGDIDQKIDKLLYYVSVSLLESSTQNLNVTDENGLSRFKNGILVDPFNDLSIADVNNAEFNAGIDFTEKSLTPSVKTIPINLRYETGSNISLHPSTYEIDAATLETTTNVPVITQPYATSFRNCVSNFYDYRGTGFIFPEYDSAYDTVTAPAQNINIDLATPFIEYTEALQEFVPLTSTQSTLISSSIAQLSSSANSTTTQQTDTFSDLVRELQVSAGSSIEQNVGEFVTNFTFNPFMRSREVNILMHGLRPNTRHYFFFDGIDVNANVVPGVVPTLDTARDVVAAGTTSTSVITDSNGRLAAIFTIPPETFYVGDRVLTISDVDTYSSIKSAGTSGGTIVYRAYNFSVNTQGLTVSTRQPEVGVATSTTTRTVANRPVTVITSSSDDDPVISVPGADPLAQTFFIKSGMSRGSDCIFASRIDLFFKRKSSINGVTVMLREVVNGYPAQEILPFSKVHMEPSEVNISDDGSVATSIFFKAPVRLDVEKEYCVVVMPDAADPDYLIYTSKIGANDLASDSPVVMDWGDGILFTSTNNRAWQSYQDEDLKFTLHRREFTKPFGTVTLTNDDNEFLTVTNITGDFQNGETVFVTRSLDESTSNTVSISAGNTEITGTGLSSTYAVDDYIYVVSGSNKDLLKIISVSSTSIFVNRPSKFTGSYTAMPAVIGKIIYYNNRNPELMYLEGSSASLTKTFVVGDLITGFTTGAFATISAIDNIELSYLQPMISKTNNRITSVTMTGTFTDPTDTDITYTRNMPFNDKTPFNEKGCVIFSKSNGSKPFELTLELSNRGDTAVTPFVDVETASILAYQYKVGANTETTSSYVSKMVELAENLDAEDLILYTSAYRPLNTNINVYVKPQNASDSLAFELNDWIQLELVEGAQTYSSTSNINDFKEYIYKLPDTAKTEGVLTYSNSSGTYFGYRKFAIKIEFIVDEVGGRVPIGSIPRLLDYRAIALT